MMILFSFHKKLAIGSKPTHNIPAVFNLEFFKQNLEDQLKQLESLSITVVDYLAMLTTLHDLATTPDSWKPYILNIMTSLPLPEE